MSYYWSDEFMSLPDSDKRILLNAPDQVIEAAAESQWNVLEPYFKDVKIIHLKC